MFLVFVLCSVNLAFSGISNYEALCSGERALRLCTVLFLNAQIQFQYFGNVLF